MSYYIPTVFEKSGNVERTYDVFSRLAKDRIIFLGSEVNDEVANAIIAQLLFLDRQDSEKEIQMFINSPGGSVTAGLGIYDTMNLIKAPIKTVCVGQACSMGAFLLSAGTKGSRTSLPNSTIMIHQPLGGASGQATEIKINYLEIERIKELLTKKMAEHTGQDYNELLDMMERDKYLTPIQAKELGLIDRIAGE